MYSRMPQRERSTFSREQIEIVITESNPTHRQLQLLDA